MKDNIFKSELMDYASKLDAVTNSCGEIVKAAADVVEEQDSTATLYLVNLSSGIIKSSEKPKEVKRLASVFKDSIMKYYGYIHILENCADLESLQKEDHRTLSELMRELNELIGLTEVKSKIDDLISYQRVQKLREAQGLYSQKRTMHLAFTGNPGTGKTTVARIIGHIFKRLGLLSKGHFLEVSRTDLIAGYQGQTALKVKKVIEKAKGGVLFIDEAYSITENDHADSYGRECLTELTKALEDYRDDLVVIVAGYTAPMKHFFESNPGLESRFNIFIDFPDYSADELFEMFKKLCTSNDYVLSHEASECIRLILADRVNAKDDNFANGRLVRNVYDDVVMNHARRIVDISEPSREDLSTILPDDLADFRGTAAKVVR